MSSAAALSPTPSSVLSSAEWIGARWLGVGLTAVLSVVTVSLAITGRIGLYINPDSAWFAVGMAVIALIGAALSFLVPLGAEADHGHDHDHGSAPVAGHNHDHDHAQAARPHDVAIDQAPTRQSSRTRTRDHHGFPARSPLAAAATLTGGVLASGVVVAALVLPPASLSVDLAMSRDVGAAPLFAGVDAVSLTASGNTSEFGVGEWATVFATSTSPDTFDGDPVTLTGFVTADPTDADTLRLTRLIITHCVIDAQPASLPVAADSAEDLGTAGTWVEIDGVVRTAADGSLVIAPNSVTPIDEPADPYEY